MRSAQAGFGFLSLNAQQMGRKPGSPVQGEHLALIRSAISVLQAGVDSQGIVLVGEGGAGRSVPEADDRDGQARSGLKAGKGQRGVRPARRPRPARLSTRGA